MVFASSSVLNVCIIRWSGCCLPFCVPWPSKLDTFPALLPDVSISSSPDTAIIYQIVSRVVGRGALGTRVCFVPLLEHHRIIQLSLQPTAESCWTPGANVKGASFIYLLLLQSLILNSSLLQLKSPCICTTTLSGCVFNPESFFLS